MLIVIEPRKTFCVCQGKPNPFHYLPIYTTNPPITVMFLCVIFLCDFYFRHLAEKIFEIGK